MAKENWLWEIKPGSSWFQAEWSQLWAYRHLLLRLVRRDFLIHHQQTVLGPLWIIFQPLIVLSIYVIIFDKAVGLSTDGLSPVLFYLSGIILWTLFSESFTGTSFPFIQNASLFGKVYFPRVIMPLSIVAGNIVRFGIQFLLFFVVAIVIERDIILSYPLRWMFALMSTTLIAAGLGFGMGLIFSILTAKYRDLVNMIHLLVRLMMFATPVIYPLSVVAPDLRKWIMINPMSSVLEFFRFGFLGQGTFTTYQLLYGVVVMVVLVAIGVGMFNKFGNKLQDVI